MHYLLIYVFELYQYFCNYFFILKFVHLRLDVKSVCKDYVEFVYKNNSIKEISEIQLWYHNQSDAWVNTEWELIQNHADSEILQVVRLTSLSKTDYGFDIRVIAIGYEEETNILRKNDIILLGLFQKLLKKHNF